MSCPARGRCRRLLAMFSDVHEIGHMLYSFAHIISACIFASVARWLSGPIHGPVPPGHSGPRHAVFEFLLRRRLDLPGDHLVRYSDVTVVFVISLVLVLRDHQYGEGLANLDREILEMARSFARAPGNASGWSFCPPSTRSFSQPSGSASGSPGRSP